MKKPVCEHCGEYTQCVCRFDICSLCKKEISNFDSKNSIYEYRWVLGCQNCIDRVRASRDFERQEIIAEESHKTSVFRWLDMWDSIIGKANRKILQSNIEIASKESWRLKQYESHN